MKIITLCGSLRFQKYMMCAAEEMALLGNCILTPIYPTYETTERTEKQLEMLKEEHFKKIELSDDEVAEKLKEMAKSYGRKEEELSKNEALVEYLRNNVKIEKAIKIIIENAKIKK